MEEDSEEQLENTGKERGYQLRPYHFQPGQSGNPGGRPKGTVSLKTWVRNMLLNMNDEERMNFLKGLNKSEIWKMAEGNPENKTDITSKGEQIVLDPKRVAIAEEYEKKLKEGL